MAEKKIKAPEAAEAAAEAAEAAAEAAEAAAAAEESQPTPEENGAQTGGNAPGGDCEPGLPTKTVAAAFGLNLRTGPGKQYPVVKVLPDKCTVNLDGGEVTEATGRIWLGVDDGIDAGWVDAAWLY